MTHKNNSGTNVELKFDTRMIEINLKNGSLTKEELKKHLQELPDLSSLCQPLDLEAPEAPSESETH